MAAPFPDFFAADAPVAQAFAPGRTELAGNHVDHQGGTVLTGALSLGTTGLAKANGLDCWRVVSEGFEPFEVFLSEITAKGEPDQALFGTSKSLVTGVLQQMWRSSGAAQDALYGVDLQVSSTLPVGGGLSSSASFEMMVAALANLLYFNNAFEPLRLAQIAQKAECDYFGKPCGLMDQAAIALGGIAQIDFSDPQAPDARVLDPTFSQMELGVVLVDLHADHAAATPLYAQIPADMQAVAAYFGATRLADVPAETFFAELNSLRQRVGDRAVLRAYHYYNETNLTGARAMALEAADAIAFLALTSDSAASSAQYLRNVEIPGSATQPALVALAYANEVLRRGANKSIARGVARIHGGGFGGSIQAFVPLPCSEAFCQDMDGLLGAGSALVLDIIPEGACAKWLQ